MKPDRGPDPPAWLHGMARVGDREIGVGMLVISHPPLPPLTVFPPAVVKLVRADVRVTAHKVGYVMGAGDDMPDAIRQLGCEVTLLTASDLEQRDLSEFDVIVTGVRAYNTRADLRVNVPRLLEYVHNGGKLIDQYNVTDGNLVPMGPYPFKVGHERVTVEEAPVTFTNLSNPLLSTPNEITQKDFEGWVQERGLYFATEWDPRYQTVLESHDPGEKPAGRGKCYTRITGRAYISSAGMRGSGNCCGGSAGGLPVVCEYVERQIVPDNVQLTKHQSGRNWRIISAACHCASRICCGGCARRRRRAPMRRCSCRPNRSQFLGMLVRMTDAPGEALASGCLHGAQLAACGAGDAELRWAPDRLRCE